MIGFPLSTEGLPTRDWERYPERCEELIAALASACGADTTIQVERFRWCRERLEADVAVGAKLGITATPAIFLDGRRVESPSVKAVEILLAHLLESKGP